MQLSGVCILTDDAPRLAAFYETVFQESPVAEGQHFGFPGAQLAVYNPGGVTVAADKNMQLMYIVPDLMETYNRLTAAFPELRVASPPQRRPWGAFSFWFLDPDGNTISLIEKKTTD
jgi:predicted enzyme related to lactoylglutathione lyase